MFLAARSILYKDEIVEEKVFAGHDNFLCSFRNLYGVYLKCINKSLGDDF